LNNRIGPITLTAAALCLILSVVIAAAAYGIGLALPKIYQSSGKIRVAVPTQGGLQDPSVTAANDLATQYAQLVDTPSVRDLTAQALGVTPSSLSGKLAGATVSAQNIIQVTATADSSGQATTRAAAAVEAVRGFLSGLTHAQNAEYLANVDRALKSMNTATALLKSPATGAAVGSARVQLIGQAYRDQAGNQPTFQVVDMAGSASQTSPQPKLYALVAFIVALIVGSRIAFAAAARRTD
jgi:capsular polysaccharide biosynthesis protein